MRLCRLLWHLPFWVVCLTALVGCQSRSARDAVVVSPSKAAPPPGVYHVVQRGQTLWGISRAYGVDIGTLKRANHLKSTQILQVGQRLFIPGATRLRQVASRCPCKPAPRAASSPRSPPRASSRRSKTPPSLQLIWPLNGPITRSFHQGGRRRHNGVDIAAAKGTVIRAAASGKVIFSAWGPRGYGRIVIIRHAAGLVTVYAHNHKNLVQSGQWVRQGTPIATVGRSGRATGYHLHFEVRRKTVPISPFPFLPQNRRLARLQRP